jgi:hypothetical protein
MCYLVTPIKGASLPSLLGRLSARTFDRHPIFAQQCVAAGVIYSYSMVCVVY